MRLLVFFDLPTKTKADKRAYILFRRFLLKDGYHMLQWSVYARITNGYDDTQTHLKRLESNLPKAGSVRYLEVSEKQYTKMKILVGTATHQEKMVTSEQFLLF